LLAVGGDNRSVLVLAAPDWKVVQRKWIGARVRGIDFTADNSQCAVLGDDQIVRVFNTTDWLEVKQLRQVRAFAVARRARLAVAALPKAEAGRDETVLAVFATPTWDLRKQIDLVPKKTPMSAALSPDSRTAYVRTIPFDDPREKEIDAGPEPKDWTERDFWKARNDGRATAIYVIDLMTGKITKEIRCFDSPGNCGFYVTPTSVVSAAYSRYLGVLDTQTWEYTVIPTGGFAYGSGCSAAGEIYTGSLASYLVLSPKGEKLADGSISRLPGFPEYFRGFTPLGSDQVAGITDAWRIILIDAAGRSVVKELVCH
jgi:hypothetical protein